ncbi:MAG TPA: LacI family DNA-binding transcriptional regulator [Euzebyales bacterium]|nr:LacI family DNA-binding transcriptional regulator [Euzebyales bacterium]
MSTKQTVTLVDVARHAGVSLATASRVLNGSLRTVGPDFRQKVVDAAQELGYVANANAQAVARGASNVVGLTVHDIADPYFSAIAAGVMRVADEHGLVMLLGSTERSPEREVEYVSMLRAQRARALIIAGSRTSDRARIERLSDEIAAFRRVGGRVACISQNRLRTDTVLPQNRAGARARGQRLAEMGHRRFAVLAGPRDLLTARDRLAGFRDGIRAAGVTADVLHEVSGPFTRNGGYDSACELLREGPRVTCLFAVNDVMAVGAMAALREHGVAVPDDVSVAGFDDILTLRDLSPALTTVRLPLEDMGVRAAQMTFVDDEADAPRIARVRGEVILRESTAQPRT